MKTKDKMAVEDPSLHNIIFIIYIKNKHDAVKLILPNPQTPSVSQQTPRATFLTDV